MASVGPRPIVIRLLRSGENANQVAPIEFAGGGEPVWQTPQRVGKRLMFRPQRRKARQNRERCDESLRRRNTEFRPGLHWQDELTALRKLAFGVVCDAGGYGAGLPRGDRLLDKVAAFPGLGNGQKKLTVQTETLVVDRRNAWRHRRDYNTQISLNQMFAEGRRMRGTAPCAGNDNLRRFAS